MLSFQNAYDGHALIGCFKQKRLLESVGELPWNYEKAYARFSFQGANEYHAEVLGVEHQTDGLWIWSWAIEESGIPQVSLNAAETLQRVGHINGIPELTEGTVSLDAVSGQQIALLGAGYTDAAGYYPMEVPEVGYVWLLLTDEAPLDRSFTAPELTLFITETLQSCDVTDQRFSVNSLLEYLTGEEVPYQDEMEIVDSTGQSLICRFDDLERLIEIKAVAAHS